MKKLAVSLLALISATSVQAATLVYTNNFDAGGYFLAAGVNDSFGGLTNGAAEAAVVDGPINATGWEGNYWANRTGGVPTGAASDVSVLELTNLPVHTSVRLEFLLGFLESWDSINGDPSPDLLEITINGVALPFALTTNTGSGTLEVYGPGNELFDSAALNGLAPIDTLAGYDFVIPHTSSTLSIGFGASGAGWEGGNDEAFGLDAFRITLDDVAPEVPEPSTWAMMLLGFGLLGGIMRMGKRRKVIASLA